MRQTFKPTEKLLLCFAGDAFSASVNFNGATIFCRFFVQEENSYRISNYAFSFNPKLGWAGGGDRLDLNFDPTVSFTGNGNGNKELG